MQPATIRRPAFDRIPLAGRPFAPQSRRPVPRWLRRPAHQGWVRRPARPTRYRVADRVADAATGRRDGRRKIPYLPPEGTAPTGAISTRRIDELRRVALERTARERENAIDDCVPLHQALEAAKSEAAAVTELAETRRADRVAAAERLTDAQLTERRSAEAELVETVVRARRGAARQRRIDKAESDLVALRQRQAAAEQQASMLQRLIADRWAAARTRAQRLHEHACRREAVYWQHLVRTHPDGARLNALIETIGPDLPEWVREPVEQSQGPSLRRVQ